MIRSQVDVAVARFAAAMVEATLDALEYDVRGASPAVREAYLELHTPRLVKWEAMANAAS